MSTLVLTVPALALLFGALGVVGWCRLSVRLDRTDRRINEVEGLSTRTQNSARNVLGRTRALEERLASAAPPASPDEGPAPEKRKKRIRRKQGPVNSNAYTKLFDEEKDSE